MSEHCIFADFGKEFQYRSSTRLEELPGVGYPYALS
jgi:hypothetical protein